MLAQLADMCCKPYAISWALGLASRAGHRQWVIAIPTCAHVLSDRSRLIQSHQALDYGVPEQNILGIRFGFKGFYDRKYKPVHMTRALVESIQLEGGTILGTSRGRAKVP